MSKTYKTAEEALDAYEDICSDARLLLTCGPDPLDPEYKGKSMSEVLSLFDEWKIKEAKRIAQRHNEWADSLDFDNQEECDKFYNSISDCHELEKVRKMAGED